MKKGLKWFIIIVLVAIFAVDMAGFWKYKLNGTPYIIEKGEGDSADSGVLEPQEPTITYTEMDGESFTDTERLYITNIEAKGDKYEVKGIKYKEVSVTKTDYTNLKSGNAVSFLGKSYVKDKTQTNAITLKLEDGTETDSSSTKFVVKYDTKTKTYSLRDSISDYVIYEATEDYYKFETESDTLFSTEKSGKVEKSTVKEMASSYNNVEITTNVVKINLATVAFNKNGLCSSIKVVVR